MIDPIINNIITESHFIEGGIQLVSEQNFF